MGKTEKEPQWIPGCKCVAYDARDETHHPGSRIREVDEEAQKALVHYHGWGANFDKWVDFADLSPDLQQSPTKSTTKSPKGSPAKSPAKSPSGFARARDGKSSPGGKRKKGDDREKADEDVWAVPDTLASEYSSVNEPTSSPRPSKKKKMSNAGKSVKEEEEEARKASKTGVSKTPKSSNLLEKERPLQEQKKQKSPTNSPTKKASPQKQKRAQVRGEQASNRKSDGGRGGGAGEGGSQDGKRKAQTKAQTNSTKPIIKAEEEEVEKEVVEAGEAKKPKKSCRNPTKMDKRADLSEEISKVAGGGGWRSSGAVGGGSEFPRHNPKFKIGAKILGASYIDHGALHLAKILKVRADKTKEGVAIWQYMLHYLKWDKKWDEWVPEDGIYLDDPAGQAKKEEIKEANKEKFELEKKMKKSKKAAKGSGEGESNIDVHDVEPKEKAYRVSLPPALQRRLLDDLDMIEERKLLPLPRTPCVQELLLKFVQSNPKRSKDEHAAVETLVSSVEHYFNMALPRMLLFSFETVKYRKWKIQNPDLKPSQSYGGEHLLRLFIKMPGQMNKAQVAASHAAALTQRLQELLKFMEKNESTLLTNEWEPADTDYIEEHESYCAACL